VGVKYLKLLKEILLRGGSVPRSNPSLVNHFDRKGNPFVHLLIKKGIPFTYYLRRIHPFLNPSNEIKEQYFGRTSSITIPEEMLTKIQEFFVQFMFWGKSRYSDFPTLSHT